MECLKCLMLMVTGFSKLAAPHIGPALTAAWQASASRATSSGTQPAAAAGGHPCMLLGPCGDHVAAECL